jgi:hypothetical protein
MRTYTSASTELQRRADLAVGERVYYDTIRSGRVPCLVIGEQAQRFSDETLLVLKVTGARYAYPRGHVFTARRGPFVMKREAIR